LKKDLLVEKIKNWLENNLAEIQKAIDNAQDSANQESKSSAGDKYETGRAMAQNDKAMFEVQLASAKAQLNVFNQIDFESPRPNVGMGSWIETNLGVFFIAVSIGKISVDDQPIMVISKDSPIAKVLWNTSIGQKIHFNGREICINEIY
jgi:transcription elongation GreA/GreB family factor